MPEIKKILLTLSVLLAAVIACEESGEMSPTPAPTQTLPPSSSNPVPRGDRILELDANPPQQDDYDAVMDHARALGAQSIRLSVYWDEIETAPGVFSPDPNWLAIANSYYPAQDMQVSLVIAVIDTTEIRLPADLEGKSLDDPAVIARFQALLDYTASQTADLELTSLAIGNEIDGVLGNSADRRESYTLFFAEAADHARSLWPDVPVGAKVMFEGLTGKSAEFAAEINRSADVVMATYYPLAGDFSVLDPGVVREDFSVLTNQYPDREIHITEIGYPTSEELGSSPEKQAVFIQEMFSAWDDHADQITLISYSWLSDLSPSSVSELEAYYGLSNRRFGEFLRTLGLRTYPGTGQEKPGFSTFREEAAARGWQ